MIFRRGEVVLRPCETWHSRPICRRLLSRRAIWASPTPYKNLVGSINGMDHITSKVVGSGPKIRVQIDASGRRLSYGTIVSGRCVGSRSTWPFPRSPKPNPNSIPNPHLLQGKRPRGTTRVVFQHIGTLSDSPS